LGAAQFQRESCRIYNHEILGGESGAHNFYICSHATHVQLWGAQCTSWHGVAEPGGAAWHSMAKRASLQPVAYAVGGQFRAVDHRAGKAKWYDGSLLYAIYQAPALYAHRLGLLVDGHHPGCMEMRQKCAGAGEFDGQTSFIWVPFLKKFLILTRANRANKATVASKVHWEFLVAVVGSSMLLSKSIARKCRTIPTCTSRTRMC